MKKLLIGVIFLPLVAIAAAAAWGYTDLRRPVSHNKSGQYIEIPKGSSPASIVKKLVSEGIIKHELPVAVYLKVTGKGSRFKAGEYDFPSPISPLGALA